MARVRPLDNGWREITDDGGGTLGFFHWPSAVVFRCKAKDYETLQASSAKGAETTADAIAWLTNTEPMGKRS